MFDTTPFISVTYMNPTLSITNDRWITKLAFSIVYNALMTRLVHGYGVNLRNEWHIPCQEQQFS